MTVLINLASQPYPAGPGVLTSGAVDPGVNRVSVTMLQVGWPNVGDRAIGYKIEYSLDGVAWSTLSVGDISDTNVVADAFRTALTIRFDCSLPNVGSTTRRVRLSFTIYKTLTMTLSLSVL